MNIIQTELKNAESKMLKVISRTDLVQLSPDNVAIVEAMIQNDSSYIKSSDKSAEPKGKYGGSTAYWMTKLKPILLGSSSVSEIKYEEIIRGAIAAVDTENSTHLNADGIGRDEITKRILAIDREKIVDNLKNPDLNDFWLIGEIARETKPTGCSKSGFKYRPRTNVSFASKFCHYACFYIFEGEPEQDNYSNYDTVLRKILPKYTDYYGLGKRIIDEYAEYQKTIDDIIKKADAKISRNGFDHLLWYYYKGRI